MNTSIFWSGIQSPPICTSALLRSTGPGDTAKAMADYQTALQLDPHASAAAASLASMLEQVDANSKPSPFIEGHWPPIARI